jgi:hypothetical protein
MTRQLLNGMLGGLAVLAVLYAVGLTMLVLAGPRAEPPGVVLVAAWGLALIAGVMVLRRRSQPAAAPRASRGA